MDVSDSDASKLLANPFYAISFTDHVFRKHSELSPKEDWIAANAQAMQELGATVWLEELLDVLSLPREKYDGHDMTSPMLVVNVSDRLTGEHEPLVTREQWVQANEKMVGEMGVEPWLWQLLDILETGGPVAA